MFTRIQTLLKNGLTSLSFSVPAALGASAGVYVADLDHFPQIKRGKLPLPKSRRQLELYGGAFGLGLFVHMIHRHSASEYQQTIDNPHNSKWYRTLVRVTTYPFRLAITEPLITVPLYFSISFGFCLFVYGKFLLEIQSMLLEGLEKDNKTKREEDAKKDKKWSWWV